MRALLVVFAALSLSACVSGEKTWAERRQEERLKRYPDPVTADDKAIAAASRRQAEALCRELETKKIRDGMTPGDYRCRRRKS
jgi:hypothetical protein